MTRFRPRISITAVTLLLTVLACAVPGLPTASAPAPTADTVLLVTMVAETVAAALEETARAAPPSSTPAPSLSPFTETATPETPVVGSTLTKREDGTTLFADQRAGYEVVVPVGWLAVRVNEQEYFDAWTLAETADPAIQDALRSIETEDPDPLRLFVVDTQDGHVQGGYVTTIRLMWDEQNDMSLADEADLVATAEVMPVDTPGLEVLATELRPTSSGLPIGAITFRTPMVTSDGNIVVILQKQVFIELSRGTLVITLATTEGFTDVILPVFDGMIETIAIFN